MVRMDLALGLAKNTACQVGYESMTSMGASNRWDRPDKHSWTAHTPHALPPPSCLKAEKHVSESSDTLSLEIYHNLLEILRAFTSPTLSFIFGRRYVPILKTFLRFCFKIGVSSA